MVERADKARYRWWQIVLVAATLSGLCWFGYVKFGHLLVIALYDGQMPIDLLNQIVKKQTIHPLHYYLDKADAAAQVGVVLFFVGGVLMAAYNALVERWPHTLVSQPLVGGIVIATGLFWVVLLLQVPLLQALPYWFWSFNNKPLSWAWFFIPLLIFSYIVLRVLFSQQGRHWRQLILLILLGYVLQHGFALMEGRGLAALTDRMTVSGHGLYARAATQQESLRRVLGHYDELLEEGELPLFPHATKPPGLLLFLMTAEKISAVADGLFGGDAVGRLSTLGALIFPLLSYAVLIPLYFFCRLYSGDEAALIAAVLFLTMPNTALITLHGDQYLYPFLGLLTVFVFSLAVVRRRLLWALLAGVLFYLALLASFALIALLPLIFILAGAEIYQNRMRWDQAILIALMGVLGFGACYLGFILVFDYDALQRYQAAMALHQLFKIQDWHIGHRLYFGFLNLVEFAVWCGLPIALLCAAQLQTTIASWRQNAWDSKEMLALALLVILAALIAVGKTVAESGRLWLFLTPLIAICAAWELQRRGGQTSFIAVVFMQLVTVLAVKGYQDFF